MRNTSTTIARVSSIFAAVLFLAIPVAGHPRNDENDFSVTQSYQATITGSCAAVWEDRGIEISARPVFVRGATTTAGAVTGFDVSIAYQEGGGEREDWLEHAFIGNRAGNEQRLGPFINKSGTGFIVEIHVHSTSTEARLEFRLASDGIVIKDKVPDKPPGFTLRYASKPIAEVQLAKRVYSYYSNVILVVDLVKLATGVISPEAFLVAFLIGQVQDQIIALIPENYHGLVGYQCKRCGRRGKLDDFSGCIDLHCSNCDNQAMICFRPISLGMKFAE